MVIAGVVVFVVMAAGAAWWLGRDTAPPPMSVDDVAASAGGPSSGGTTSLDGTWTVDPASESQAGLRIVEDRFGGLRDNTAVGRTPAVTGSLTVDGTTVAAGSFTADLSKIEFSDDPGLPVASRSTYLRTKSLETDRFPDATFELTEPVRLASLPADGQTVTLAVRGDLTIHGVTRPVLFRVAAKPSGSTVALATAKPVPVKLADHDIDVPELRNVSKVRGTGEFEFLVVLRRA